MWQWCSRRSISAAAITSSPSTCPHSSKPLFEVSTVRCVLVARVDELEEHHRSLPAHRQVADLVDNHQRRVGQHSQAAGQLPGRLGLRQRLDQACQSAVVDPTARLGGGYRQADSQMSLPDPRRPKQDHVLPPCEEPELVQTIDLLAFDARLKGEVELRQGP